eukprot:CAMPEP_0118914084 /NCGR_PEP_ID=MMETSP1166-20130328/14587_1 /TAXON_ID=1104430 /ORGANISM="Chrysoreinhardia sp, Strain CCMP3193" /LENGTH=888 /DNA_ID=CAMNT_0006853651 /DNA_START=75 /DNA_END=2741 /DNA_ORIENTATION=-
MVLVQLGVATSIFSWFVAGTKHAVAPEAPNSDVGRARSLRAFLSAALGIRDEVVCKANGIDAFLATRLCKMRFDAAALWLALVAGPAAVVYAWNANGSGATMSGFSRLSLANIANLGGVSLHARLWVIVYGSYVVLGAGLWLCDRYDEESLPVIQEAVAKAPGHHYVIAVVGLAPSERDPMLVAQILSPLVDEEDPPSFFACEVRCDPDVLEVHLVEGFSLDYKAARRESSPGTRRRFDRPDPALGIHWHDGALLEPWLPWTVSAAVWELRRNERLGLEGAVVNYVSALRVATRRDEELLACHNCDRIDRLVGRAQEARLHCEARRANIAEMLYREKPPQTAVAFVVFNSLASARRVLDRRDLPDGWLVLPAPEPRDIIWENLERASGPDNHGVISTFRLRVGSLLFGAGLFLTSAVIFACAMSAEEPNLSKVMMAGVLPAMLFKSIMTTVVGVGLRRLHYFYGPKLESWTKSKIESRTLLDAAFFVGVVTVVIPWVGAVFIAAAKARTAATGGVEGSHHRSKVDGSYVAPRVLAVAVLELPTIGMVIATALLLKLGDLGVAALRVSPYLHFLQAKRVQEQRHPGLFKKSPKDYRNLAMPAEPVDYMLWANWELLATASGAAYAPIAPLIVVVSVIFLGCALKALRLDLATASSASFNMDGALSRPGVVATQVALVIAFLFHVAVVFLCGAILQFLVLLPLAGLAVVFATRSRRRWLDERHSMFSALHFSRPSLAAAQNLDVKRFQTRAARNCAAFCSADRLWASRVAPPRVLVADGNGREVEDYTTSDIAGRHLASMIADLDFFPGMAPLDDYEDMDDRVEPMVTWLGRYDTKTAVPTFFTVDDHTEDIVFKNLTLVRIADGTWRKMKDQRKKHRRTRLITFHSPVD